MRGSKAKALRRYAFQAIQHGIQMQVRKSGDQQAISNPVRYLYQSLKGKNTNLIYSRGGK